MNDFLATHPSPGWVTLMALRGAPSQTCQAGGWEGPVLEFMSLIHHSSFFLWYLALVDSEKT